MDPQQPLNSSSPQTSYGPNPNFSSVVKPPGSGGGNNSLLYILIGILGFGSVSFGGVAIVSFNEAHAAKTNINQQKQSAADDARADQKKKDGQAAELAAENPFRSYIAPIEYGSFEIRFPANWSATIDQERQSQTQVTLTIHPDFVKKDNNTDELSAAKVMLVQRTLEEFLKTYNGQKDLKRNDVTVAGVKGVTLTGKFLDKRTTRLVVIPIRDKSLVFISEDNNYSSQFDQILAQSKALP